jgi:predicted enzyme related to lactoylglutathione lyase
VTSMPLAAVRIFVRNLDEAIAFYRTNFDWSMTGGGAGEGYCVFDVGNINLVIESVAMDADEEDQTYVGRFTGVSFRVDDIASAYERMRANGVVFSGAPEKQFWGGTLATLLDPAGNGVQIVQYAT